MSVVRRLLTLLIGQMGNAAGFGFAVILLQLNSSPLLLSIRSYLLLFLKFIASVVPTIQ